MLGTTYNSRFSASILIMINSPYLIRIYSSQRSFNEGRVMADQGNFWQQDDKSIIGKVFLMVGVFAAVMTGVAIGIGFVL
jgi:hypothetical protein